jgi:prevent-host-death family protein
MQLIMDSIPVSEFRANMQQILDEVQQGKCRNITSRGKVIARLVPAEDTRQRALEELMEMRKTAFVGDVMSPIDVEWNALNDND